MRFAKNIVAASAAVGMLAMPVAAQAGTRAGDAEIRVAPVAQSVETGAARTGAAVSEENRIGGGGATIIAILAAVAVIAGIIIAVDDDESDGA